MSFEGRNFDVVTGVTALVLALFLYRREVGQSARRAAPANQTVGTAWVLAWNVLGAVLLANIVGVALISLPWIHAFGEERVNEWVLHFPFVWLPAVLVQAALFGHLVVFRRLRLAGDRAQTTRTAGSSAARR